MIKESFIVSDITRMLSVDLFIKQKMPTCRYLRNPDVNSVGIWSFYISYEIDDMNKLGELLNKFHEEDDKIAKQIELRKTIIYKIKKFFKIL